MAGCGIRVVDWELVSGANGSDTTASAACVRIRRQMEFDAEGYIGRMMRTNSTLRFSFLAAAPIHVLMPIMYACIDSMLALVDYEVEIAHLLVENERALVLVCALFSVKHDPRILRSFIFTFFLNCASGKVQLLSLRPVPCDQLASLYDPSLSAFCTALDDNLAPFIGMARPLSLIHI